MTFKTPSFWYPQDKNAFHPVAFALRPFSWLYAQATKLHEFIKTPQKIDIPVICIGNLNAGGSGKTPTAIALMKLIQDQELAVNPMFLTRGYGGDESILLARHAPTTISAHRFMGAEKAKNKGADMIIMDDGLQNHDLIQDLKIAVIDSQMGFGNEKTMPAGPLREDLKTGLNKPDIFVIIGEDKNNISTLIPTGKTIVNADISVDISALRHEKYIAFCGLGYPKKFFETLHAHNINLHQTIAYADHHPYTHKEIETLQQTARNHQARLVTTEKDMVRIPEQFKDQIDVLPITLTFQDPDILINTIKNLQA